MNKNYLLIIGVAVLLAGCSKKEMMPASGPNLPADYTAGPAKQVTWTQGNAIIDGTYNIFAIDGTKALDVAAGPQLNDFTNHNSQKWNISDAGNGYFKIENVASGKALTAKKNTAAVQQTQYNNSDAQLWTVTHQKQGLYKVSNKASGLALTLDDAGTVTQSAYTASNKQLMGIVLHDYAAATDSVTIDFSSISDTLKHVAAGFLHGFKPDGNPPDSLLIPLNINTVRDWIFSYPQRAPRLNNLGYKQQIVVSDGWAAPYNSNGPPGNNGDWTAWENNVKSTVTQTQALVPASKLQYDLWNEPNIGSFWNFTGTYAFPGWFFETWKHGYNAARSVNPDAVLVGPSFSSYDVTNLKAFLTYCKTNNCVPDYLSWHFPTDPVAQVAEMTQFMADNDIHVKGFIINEYTLAAQQTAGKSAYLIAQLERAKVSAAMHAIWSPLNGDDGQLDGILTPDFHKKATWWVYKIYGSQSGQIVKTTPSANIELLAAFNDQTRVFSVLLGCRAKVGEGVIKVKFLHVTPELTQNDTKVHFVLQRIPDALNVGAITNGVPTQYNNDVTITYGDKTTLLIPWNSEYDAFTFRVTKAEQH